MFVQAVDESILGEVIDKGVIAVGVRATGCDMDVIGQCGQRLVRLAATSAEFCAAESTVLNRHEAVQECGAEKSIVAESVIIKG